MVEYKAFVRLGSKQVSGAMAYETLVAALAAEIEEKQAVLEELFTECVKHGFIANWSPDVKQMCICEVDEEDDDHAV